MRLEPDIDSASIFAEALRREGDRWITEIVRGGVEHNYRMILVGDAVADVHRDTHEAELKTMARVFADVKTTDEVVALLSR
jgi:nicotinamidase-related amidase